MVDLVLFQCPDMLPLEDSIFRGRWIAYNQGERDDCFAYDRAESERIFCSEIKLN